MIRRRSLNQRGETIMEVLICVSVVGLMMTAAFALSNRNQALQQSSEEHVSATSLIQSQLEKLRNYADVQHLPVKDLTSAQGLFCVTDTNTIAKFTGSMPSEDAAGDTDLAKYPAACKLGGAGDYRVAIWPPGTNSTVSATGGSRYLVTIRWTSPTGDGINQNTLYYEIYDTNNPMFAAAPPAPACSDRIDNDGDGKIDAFGYTVPVAYVDSFGHTVAAGFHAADPGCNGDINGGTEKNAACNNASEVRVDGGDDDGDGFIDMADPDCSGPTDNDEYFAHYTASILGKNFATCTPYEGSPCQTVGNGVTSCGNYAAEYNTSSLPAGKYKLTLNYQDLDCAGAGAPTPPASLYQYSVNVYVNGALTAANVRMDPPSGIKVIDLGNIGANPKIKVYWTNNYWVSDGVNLMAYDPDFQINSLKMDNYE